MTVMCLEQKQKHSQPTTTATKNKQTKNKKIIFTVLSENNLLCMPIDDHANFLFLYIFSACCSEIKEQTHQAGKTLLSNKQP